jgi:nitrogen fixation NifU-like protein
MALNELDDLYREAILDHSRNPRNSDEVKDADITGNAVNPFCGDEIHLQIRLSDEGHVEHIGLQGEGCSINQATGSMITKAIKGKTLEEIEAVSTLFKSMIRGHSPTEEEIKELGELESLSSVRQFPVRIKCALLAWSALEDGIDEYRK